MKVELLVILQESTRWLDRLIHVHDMSKDDTDYLLAISKKMESLAIQQKRQSFIKDFFK